MRVKSEYYIIMIGIGCPRGRECPATIIVHILADTGAPVLYPPQLLYDRSSHFIFSSDENNNTDVYRYFFCGEVRRLVHLRSCRF